MIEEDMMGSENWITRYGADSEKRIQRIQTFKRLKKWGNGFIVVALSAFLYLLLWDPPSSASDAFAAAVALSVCFSAGFALTSTSDTEIKLYELLEEIKK